MSVIAPPRPHRRQPAWVRCRVGRRSGPGGDRIGGVAQRVVPGAWTRFATNRLGVSGSSTLRWSAASSPQRMARGPPHVGPPRGAGGAADRRSGPRSTRRANTLRWPRLATPGRPGCGSRWGWQPQPVVHEHAGPGDVAEHAHGIERPDGGSPVGPSGSTSGPTSERPIDDRPEAPRGRVPAGLRAWTGL